jgi:hypothetical protein
MEVRRSADKKSLLGERMSSEESGGALPMAHDGGILQSQVVDQLRPIPAATPENFVCLRGPCVRYLEITSTADVNAPTLGRDPIQLNRYCRAIPGVEIDLTEDAVFACSDWDPVAPKVLEALQSRRDAYLNNNAACRAADEQRAKR